jgi:hypothetical protein
MAAITASMVAELRGKTDAPMMECKKALTEADGDMAKAEEILRVKLGNKAGKAAVARDRRRRRGLPSADGKTGAMVEVNCETDFRHQERRIPGAGQGLRTAGRRAEPGRRGGAVGPARMASARRSKTCARAGRQDRREHDDPPLRALEG